MFIHKMQFIPPDYNFLLIFGSKQKFKYLHTMVLNLDVLKNNYDTHVI